ncbi:hypothetical protein L2E82_52147 [Cichorium intybus]|nr:hypothetical protein L1887_63271 [Cichorium endivia]KAI3674583.1 hypothetical protein L2E82_52147 [Cichorium intybus]KAI3477548.1 hypothetical protein L1887_60690 [Cichorium endivia]KAI3478324.1 hypothetical protein L1887_59768 [Cichorium endivia]KAI3478753.1 hypothetical protein L1887_59261 [Cichorium endivia]
MRQRPFSYLFTVTKRLIDPGLYRCLVMAFSAAGERERYNLTVSSLLDLTILFVLFARFTLSKKGLLPLVLVARKAFAVLYSQAESPLRRRKIDQSKLLSKKGSARASVEASASDSAMADSSDCKLFDGGCLGKSRRLDYINYHGIRGSDSRLTS